MSIAQTGQYNHMRMARRGEFVTVSTVLSKFIDGVTGMVFLLNKTYRPYYKWENRMLRSLPILGASIGRLLDLLVHTVGFDSEALEKQQNIISEICTLLHSELKNKSLPLQKIGSFQLMAKK